MFPLQRSNQPKWSATASAAAAAVEISVTSTLIARTALAAS